MFEQTFVESGNRTRKSAAVLFSAFMWFLVIGVAVLIPLIWTDKLPAASLMTMITAPPPPSASTPASAGRTQDR